MMLDDTHWGGAPVGATPNALSSSFRTISSTASGSTNTNTTLNITSNTTSSSAVSNASSTTSLPPITTITTHDGSKTGIDKKTASKLHFRGGLLYIATKDWEAAMKAFQEGHSTIAPSKSNITLLKEIKLISSHPSILAYSSLPILPSKRHRTSPHLTSPHPSSNLP